MNSDVSLSIEENWAKQGACLNLEELIVNITLSSYNYLVSCSVSLLNSTGRYCQHTTGMHYFELNGEVWQFKTKITKAMLMSYKSRFLHGDTLSLKFTCTLSDKFSSLGRIDKPSTFGMNSSIVAFESTTSTCGSENMQLNPSHLCSKAILQDLKGMYEDGFMSDFSLRVGDKTFPVHKAILGARSSVFRSMFTTEMKDKQDNCVVIEDVDADTLQRMLQYFYSDKLDTDMGWKSAFSLYVAADKYAVETLQQGCSAVLKFRLCSEGALDVLLLANMHNDQDLKSATLDFISWNDKEIVGTERWVKFEEENSQLAHDHLKKLYIKKMNG